jgi:hypothetical protein
MLPKIRLSNGIEFTYYSHTEPSSTGKPKLIPKDILNVLSNPKECTTTHPEQGKFYLGQGAIDPSTKERFPIWLDSNIFSQHWFIGGAIGSGKTILLNRFIAGGIKTYGTVVVAEAKGGLKGNEEGAAFTDLAQYLRQKIPNLAVYRWPRGNCTFNPFLYLTSPQDRRSFFETICQEIEVHSKVTGDMIAFLHNAVDIAEYIVIYMQNYHKSEEVTLRNLVKYLKYPDFFLAVLDDKIEKNKGKTLLLKEIKAQLIAFNFFYLDKIEFAMTRHGRNAFLRMFEHEDLLFYTEPHSHLKSLDIENILYQRSLVVLSQPLSDASSSVVGPLFLDSLLARVLEKGPKPQLKEGKAREKVLIVLDETHRLPTGRMGTSGDFSREYNIGFCEIAPTIINQQRWEQNQHVYQTILSLSPGIPTLVGLMRDRLPNFFLDSTYTSMNVNADGNPQLWLKLREDYKHQLSQDNPGVSQRSLQMSGRFTGLLQSHLLDGERKLFWIDFEDELLANLNTLLRDALDPNCPQDIKNAVDYALGLSEYKPS